MDMEMAKILGNLGTNVDQNVTLDWLKTQVANYVAAGDRMSLYKLYQFARHSEQKEVRDFAKIYLKFLDGYVEGKAPTETADTEKSDKD